MKLPLRRDNFFFVSSPSTRFIRVSRCIDVYSFLLIPMRYLRVSVLPASFSSLKWIVAVMLSCYSILHIHILHLYHHCHHHHHCHHCHHCQHHHSRYPFSLFFLVSNTNQEVKTKEERKKTTADCVSDFSPPTYSVSSPSHLLILSTLDLFLPA